MKEMEERITTLSTEREPKNERSREK